jgi:hypothetical protein
MLRVQSVRGSDVVCHLQAPGRAAWAMAAKMRQRLHPLVRVEQRVRQHIPHVSVQPLDQTCRHLCIPC